MPQLNFEKLDERFEKKFPHCQDLECGLCKRRGLIKSFLHQSLFDYHKKVMEVLEGMEIKDDGIIFKQCNCGLWVGYADDLGRKQAKDKIKEIEV